MKSLKFAISESIWFLRFAAFFFWKYLISLVKQWTFWAFLALDIFGVAQALVIFQVNIPHEYYWGAAVACILIANIEVIRKKEFLTLTKSQREYSGHTYKVNSIFLSSDDHLLVSSADRVAILWDIKDGSKIHRLECDTWVGQAIFASDDKSVIGVGGKGKYFHWDVDSGDLVREKEVHSAESVAVALAPDGKRVATGGKDGKIFLWKFPDMRKVKTLTMGDTTIRKVSFHPNQKILAACDVDGKVAIFDLVSGDLEIIFQQPDNEPIRYVTYSHDGSKLAFVDGAGNVYVYNCENRTLLPPQKGHSDMALCCQFNSKGNILATSGQDKRIVLWKIRPQKLTQLFSIAGHEDAVLSVTFEHKTNNLFSSSTDKKIKYWKLHYLLFSDFLLGK